MIMMIFLMVVAHQVQVMLPRKVVKMEPNLLKQPKPNAKKD